MVDSMSGFAKATAPSKSADVSKGKGGSGKVKASGSGGATTKAKAGSSGLKTAAGGGAKAVKTLSPQKKKTVSSSGETSDSNRSDIPVASTSPAGSGTKAVLALKQAVSSAPAGALAHEASAPAPTPASAAVAAPAPAPGPPADVVGQIKVRYNHYCQSFDVVNGKLDWSKIDDSYCISFVFKGDFIPRLLPEASGGDVQRPALQEDGEAVLLEGGCLTRHTDEEGDLVTAGTFAGLSLLNDKGEMMVYQLAIDEDDAAELAAEAKKRAAAALSRAGASGPGLAPGVGQAAVGGLTCGSAHVTTELKKLSLDELREGSDRYKALLEARDLEDVLYGSG